MFTGVPLGIQLFDSAFQNDLIQAMAAVRRGDRQHVYDQLVGGLANSHPLPSVAAFVANIPACIVPTVDDLYRSLAALDYRQRRRNYDAGTILLKINRCILILDNQEKFRRWRERRDREREAALAKQQKRPLSVSKMNGA
jgi:hypothetical protein